MKMGRTTRAQLTLIQMITCTVAVVAAGIAFGLLSYLSNRRACVQDLRGLAEAISHNSEAALMFNIEEDAQQILQILHTRDSVTSAYLYDANGAVFAAYIPEGKAPSAYIPPATQSEHVFNENGVRVYHPVAVQGQVLGTVCIEDNMASVRDATKRNVITLVVVILGALFIALLTASKLQALISKPILGLAYTARRVSTDADYSCRASAGGSEEIQLLNAAFNEMLENLSGD